MEVWKDVDGYEGLYKVSNYGNVLSMNFGKRSQKLSGITRILKQSKSSSGYYHVQLYKDCKASTKLIHKLVATAFVDNPDGKLEINHIDGDKTNNHANNLEWVTRSENTLHAINHGLRKASPMENIRGKDNPNSKQIAQYTLDGSLIRVWTSAVEASLSMGCSADNIRSCANNNNLSAYGYIWIYTNGQDTPTNIEPPKRYRKPNKVKNKKYRNLGVGKGNYQHKHRKIQQFDTDNNLIRTWDGYKQIIAETNYSISHIYGCNSGRLKSAYGYIWKCVD